jgi:hypothetical protein
MRWRSEASTTEKLYGAIVAQARLPVFYRSFGVPDTLQGRFTLLALHLFAVLHRLKSGGPEGSALAQDLVDRFSQDMETVLRELGVSDMRVPQSMRRLAAASKDLFQDYEAALASDESALAHAIAERQPYTIEHRIIRPDGQERTVLEHAEITYDAQGRAVQIIGAVQDITEPKRAENALREADRRKDEFLAMLSHELRNPLAPVRNAVQVLRLVGSKEPPAVRQHDIIERQVTHMARLLDDLLDVSRATRGKIVLDRKALRLADVLTRAVEVGFTEIFGQQIYRNNFTPIRQTFISGFSISHAAD